MMSDPLVLAVVLGTRPEAVKLAPVIIEAAARPGLRIDVISTGQHDDMLRSMIEWFGIELTLDLEVMTPDQTISGVAAAALDGLSKRFRDHRPDWVLVQGDTTTAFVGALAGFYDRIRVAHVEAGLRTDDRFNPYPEEMNRRLVGRLADLHLAPTARAADNLRSEGVTDAAIEITGNTGIDALFLTLDRLGVQPQHSGGRRILVTAHRRENHGEAMRGICEAILRLLERYPDLVVEFPMHRSPRVRAEVVPLLGQHPRVQLGEPMPHHEFVQAMARATLILSDSGGVQEEAPSLGKPVLVMRDSTERPEAIEAGVAELVGCRPDDIVASVTRLFDDPVAYEQMAKAVNPFGDGTAARQTIDSILRRS